MTQEEFAKRIKEKYPAYKDIDDTVLVDKVLQKYPVYRDQVEIREETPVREDGTPLAQTITEGLNRIYTEGRQEISEHVREGAEKFSEAAPSAVGVLAERPAVLLNTLFRSTGSLVKTAFRPITDPFVAGIERTSDVLSDIPGLQQFANSPVVSNALDKVNSGLRSGSNSWQDFKKNNPEGAKDVEAGAEILFSVLGEKGTQKAVSASVQIAKKTTQVPQSVAESAGKFVEPTKKGIIAVGRGAYTVTDALSHPRLTLSKTNVRDNFASSVDRINEISLRKSVETPLSKYIEIKSSSASPLERYDKFYSQELKFKEDTIQDTALGKVGETIGNKYQTVVQARRKVGAAIEEELKVIGGQELDISHRFYSLETELANNGAIYSNGNLIFNRASRFSTQDKKLLEAYIDEFNKLGGNPTVEELNAFVSRMPNELSELKAAQNVTKVTNAERIAKGHMAQLRREFDRFKEFKNLRDDYSSLTLFLDEGSRFLGRKTQTGDYAKDASLAKSSVQSILNQGKKDWLLQLEELTGYPAMDESMLALQAMRDAGNFRGESLLELLSPKTGVIPKNVGEAAEKVKDVGLYFLIGNDAAQTRRVIQARMDAGLETTPSQF